VIEIEYRSFVAGEIIMKNARHFFKIWTFLIATRAALIAQCPAINFYTTPELQPPNGGTDIVVVRQPDGSFTEYGLGGATPSFTTPNIQSTVSGCLPASTHTGPRVTINYNPTGVASEPGAIADLNGNGIPELLIAETNPGLTIFYDFNLANPTVYLPEITVPTGVSVADLNGDGHPDVVVLDGGDGSSDLGNVYILLNKGDGTLTPAPGGGRYAVSAPGSVAIADVNGDGKPDLVVGLSPSTTTGIVAVLLGNGDGTFQNPTNFPASGVVISVVVADFNGDGHPDIAYVTLGNSNGSGPNAINILLGNGSGGFTSAGSGFSAGGDAAYLVAGDFNGDGRLDLAAGNFRASTVTVLLGNGNGTFQAPYGYSVPYGPTELTVTDFNDDGFADILIGVGSPTAVGESENSEVLGVLLGNGDGTFRGAPTTDIGGSESAASFLAVADFNGDGKVDAILADQTTGNVAFFAGNGNGTFQTPVLHQGELSQPGVAAVGDFNGDGRPDLAVAQTQSSNLFILLNSGGGNFQSPSMTGSGGFGPAGLAAADFNGDGKIDLAVANSGGFNGSGQNQAGNVAILTGSGSGSFSVSNTYVAGTAPTGIAAADLNGDGKPDLVVADAGMNGGTGQPFVAGGVYVFLNQGSSFQKSNAYPVSTFPNIVAIGDLNGDGRPDLVVAASDDNVNYYLGILLGNGNGTFQSATLLPTQFGPSSIAIDDFNGDGKVDLIVGHCCGDTDATYLLGHGDGTFDPEVQFNAGSSQFVAAADITGNGLPDLLVAQSNPAAFMALINVSAKAQTQAVSTASSAPAPSGAPVAAESIASAYGSDLANTTAPAKTLGTSLGGTTMDVKDSAGTDRPATLFYVSPSQVNFEIPTGTTNGTATVNVHSGDGTTSSGTVQIASVAPGLYTVNSAGLAAAYAEHYSASGTLTSQQNVAEVNSSNQVVASPISLDPQGSQVYLLLFGTGLRHAALSDVTVTVGSTVLQPAYSGAQGGFVGLDQINVLLPYSLKGSGDVPVVVTASGLVANTVRITIQ
jgi:uncharacterized protein (TIGR03437 family)